jgi:Ca2+-binding EF-hand superfamily protein
LETNKLTPDQLLKKISSSREYSGSHDGVQVADFASFMKRKIDKKRPENHLRQISHQIDVDKDGVINIDDLNACLKNIKCDTFFKNGGEALMQSTFASSQKFYPNV